MAAALFSTSDFPCGTVPVGQVVWKVSSFSREIRFVMDDVSHGFGGANV